MTQEETKESLINKVEQEEAEVGDIEALRQALAEEKEKAQGYLANWQRAQADFINYKRRSEQEKEEISKFANAMLMFNLLPVIDEMPLCSASSMAEATLKWPAIYVLWIGVTGWEQPIIAQRS